MTPRTEIDNPDSFYAALINYLGEHDEAQAVAALTQLTVALASRVGAQEHWRAAFAEAMSSCDDV